MGQRIGDFMNKKLLTLAAIASATAGAFYAYKKINDGRIHGTYRCFAEGDDFGCCTSEVIVQLDKPIDRIGPSDLEVSETKQVYGDHGVEIQTLPRTIEDAYMCDEAGHEVFSPSRYFKIELKTSPLEGSIFLFDMDKMLNQYSFPYQLKVQLSKKAKVYQDGHKVYDLVIDTDFVDMETSADCFKDGHFDNGKGMAYDYVAYTPEEQSDQLIVWLHGLGEGGTAFTDPYVTVLANKVTALANDPFQSIVGGAHVLSIQCPTFWMDCDGEGEFTTDGSSFYLESLIECIDAYAASIGAKKICIAGCSNGGFMTMLIARTCGLKYQAYVPICEALRDDFISDEDIATLSQLPLFFIYSEDDTTVDPNLFERPTIERLKQAGAKYLAYYEAEGIYDRSGRFFKEDGSPYQYNGHWSWIYFDNNDAIDERTGLPVFQWIRNYLKGSQLV